MPMYCNCACELFRLMYMSKMAFILMILLLIFLFSQMKHFINIIVTAFFILAALLTMFLIIQRSTIVIDVYLQRNDRSVSSI